MIDIVNLTKEYNGKKILDNICLKIDKNDKIAIIGKSGTGKTTLSNILSKLDTSYKGNILYELENIRNINQKKYSKKVSIVFQEYNSSLNPYMKVIDILTEPLKIHKEKVVYSKIKEILNTLGLGEIDFNKSINELSGGQKQRIVFARTLILNPDCIILDEAISSLDVDFKIKIVNIIKNLNKSIIFITHDLDFIKYVTNKVYLLKDGSLILSNNML